jgi:hypothetical protein
MMGFPPSDHFQGPGVFSHIVKLDYPLRQVRFATNSDCSPYSHVHVRRESVGGVPRSMAILCRHVPNPTRPIRNQWTPSSLINPPASHAHRAQHAWCGCRRERRAR